MKALAAGLLCNRSVTSLNLGENQLTEASATILIDLLRANPTINQLYLDWGATSAGVSALQTTEKATVSVWAKGGEHAGAGNEDRANR